MAPGAAALVQHHRAHHLRHLDPDRRHQRRKLVRRLRQQREGADLTASFTDTSTDSDGTVVVWSWDFGDGNGSSAQNPSHSYAAGGIYSVTLTVTDNDGDSDSDTQSATVTAADLPPAAPTNLTANVESSGKGKDKVVTGVTLAVGQWRLSRSVGRGDDDRSED